MRVDGRSGGGREADRGPCPQCILAACGLLSAPATAVSLVGCGRRGPENRLVLSLGEVLGVDQGVVVPGSRLCFEGRGVRAAQGRYLVPRVAE